MGVVTQNIDSYLNRISEDSKSEKGLFSTRRAVKRFIRGNPVETEQLVEHYDSVRGGFFGYFPRRTHSRTRKLRELVDEHQTSHKKGMSRMLSGILKHKVVLGGVLATQGLLSALSPNHPLKVDAYLLNRGADYITQDPISHEVLEDFLLSDLQLVRYENNLLEDAKNPNSEKTFVIVRNGEGQLEHKNVRTIHEKLPSFLPDSIRNFLDRKHLPRLDDYTELWLEGNEIVAKGHYHAFGENPSKGDSIAVALSPAPEIVISNGLAPRVYIDGEFVGLGEDIVLLEENKEDYVSLSNKLLPTEPEESKNTKQTYEDRLPYVANYLGFLREKYDTDVTSIEDIKRDTSTLYHDFISRYPSFDDATHNGNSEDSHRFANTQKRLYNWAIDYEPSLSPLEMIFEKIAEHASELQRIENKSD